MLFSFLSACSFSEAEKNKNEVRFSADSIIVKDSSYENTNIYSWLSSYENKNSLINRIQTPDGYTRISLDKKSFAEWLRFIPLKDGKPLVHLYNGTLKLNQTAHYAVIDVDVGTSDLQQCAEAVIRLRAEYLYSQKLFSQIHFKYTSGDEVSFQKWSKGYRPVINNNKVSFTKSAKADSSYKSFRSYMNSIFMYAGTLSLTKELKSVKNLKDILPGDVFIFGGSPGHAVTVMDVAANEKGEKIFILSQSYMPAQEMHVLINPNNSSLSPWYSVNEIGEELITPEWIFSKNELKQF